MAKDSGTMVHTAASIAWRRFSPCFVIFALTSLAFFPAFSGDFLFGDRAQITSAGLRSLLGLQRIWFEPGATPQYFPLLHTVYWLEFRLWADAPFGYHAANIIQHAIASCLIVAIVRRLELPGALLAGLIFAIHPVAVGSVAWIAQQGTTLSTVFFLAAALCYIAFDHERIMWQYDLALAFFVLALLTKTTTAVLPFVLLVVCWYERGRLEWRRDFVPLLPWWALAIGAVVLTIWFDGRFGSVNADAPALGWLERGRTVVEGFWYYVRTTLWPMELPFIVPSASSRGPLSYLGIGSFGALVVGVVWLRRRWRGPLAGLLVFLGTLIPLIALEPDGLTVSRVADPFQYLARVGWLVPLAVALTIGCAQLRIPRWVGPSTAGLLAAVLMLLTWRQAARYANPGALYEHAAKHPGAWLAHQQLGQLYAENPARLAEAVAHYKKAIALAPAEPRTYALLGRVLAQLPDQREAALHAYETSLRLRDDDAIVRADYANALAALDGRLTDAIAEYERALSLSPDYADGYYHLAQALARQPGRAHEAIAALEKAVRLEPDHFFAYRDLGDALALDPARRLDAIAAYEGALHVHPGEPELHRKRAALLASIPGREPEAVAALQRALELQPDNDAARAQLEALRNRGPTPGGGH